MSNPFSIVYQTLSADLAAAGTFTVNYPTGTNAGTFYGAVGHQIVDATNDVYTSPDDFTLTFGTSNITVTSVTMAITAANADGSPTKQAQLLIQLKEVGESDGVPSPDRTIEGAIEASCMVINLGAPDAASATALAAVQLAAAAGNLTLTSATTLDVPRNVTLTGATTDHSAVTATVTGTDVLGNTVVETMACPFNNTVAGKKAFKTVTSIAVDGAIATTGISAGFADVLGLPVFLPKTGMVVKELQDGAAATAGTLVAGVDTVATATTGDVRGTYDPNAACDGAKVFELIVAMPNPAYTGRAQYAG